MDSKINPASRLDDVSPSAMRKLFEIAAEMRAQGKKVIDFDLDTMLEWMKKINPCMIWLGYDSKKNNLPEPELAKVRKVHWELSRAGFVVILKTIREAR